MVVFHSYVSLPEGNSNIIGYYEQQYDDEVALNFLDIHPKVRAMLIGKTMTNDQALDLNPCHVSTPKLQHMLKPLSYLGKLLYFLNILKLGIKNLPGISWWGSFLT